MKVSPKTEAEIAEANLIPDGTYIYSVLSAIEKESKGGNDMVQLNVQIFDDQGEPVTRIFDYLVNIESMAYKLRHFADSAGLINEYEAGDLPAELMIGATGKCKVGTQPAKDGFAAKNVIKDYVKLSDGDALKAKPKMTMGRPSAAAKNAKTETLVDDDIPF